MAFADELPGLFTPSLVASGTVTLFQVADLRSRAIWASHAKNVKVTVSTNFGWFELAGGARLNGQAVVNGDMIEAIDSVEWASGVIGTYAAMIAPGVTGFVSRAVSGVDLTTRDSTVARVSTRQGALALSTGYLLVSPTTASRIASISFTGSMTGNNAQFAFRAYPAGWFRFGALNVLVPAAPASGPTQAVDLFTSPNPRAFTVFRPARE